MAGIKGQRRILGWADVSLLRGFRNLTSGARILDPRILQYFRKMDFGTKRPRVTLFSIKKWFTVNMLSLIKSVREK